MPTYRLTRLWSVAGYTVTDVDADSEESARAIEETRWEAAGAVAALPAELSSRLEDVFEEVEIVEEIQGS